MAFEELGIGAIAGLLIGLGVMIIVLVLILIAALYVYTSLALMTIAKRLQTEPAWLAWIPIANLVLMAKMAKMHWWPVLLVIGMVIPWISPLAGIALLVFIIIWSWKICEARKRPGWYAVLTIIPFVGGIWALILYGILAWSKD